MSGSQKYSLFQRALRLTGMEKDCKGLVIAVIVGFNIGALVDRSDTNSMVIYRDRSALYGGKVKEGDQPSWPSRETWWT